LIGAKLEKILGADAGTGNRQFEPESNIKPGETESGNHPKARNELAKLNISAVVTWLPPTSASEKFRHPIPTLKIFGKKVL